MDITLNTDKETSSIKQQKYQLYNIDKEVEILKLKFGKALAYEISRILNEPNVSNKIL